MSEHSTTHEKSHVAQNLAYTGYSILAGLTVLDVGRQIIISGSVVMDEIIVSFIGATSSLITWLIAKNGQSP